MLKYIYICIQWTRLMRECILHYSVNDTIKNAFHAWIILFFLFFLPKNMEECKSWTEFLLSTFFRFGFLWRNFVRCGANVQLNHTHWSILGRKDENHRERMKIEKSSLPKRIGSWILSNFCCGKCKFPWRRNTFLSWYSKFLFPTCPTCKFLPWFYGVT